MVHDGWSYNLFLGELLALYRAFSQDLPSPLPPLQLQFVDYAAWERGQVDDIAESQLAWWRQRLAGAPPLLELPSDRPRPAMQSMAGASLRFALSQECHTAVQGLMQDQGATLFHVLLRQFHGLDAALQRPGRYLHRHGHRQPAPA